MTDFSALLAVLASIVTIIDFLIRRPQFFVWLLRSVAFVGAFVVLSTQALRVLAYLYPPTSIFSSVPNVPIVVVLLVLGVIASASYYAANSIK